MKTRTVILDNGHGGIINGVYQTHGKRSPDFGKGIIYEGDFNRDIVNRVSKLLKSADVPFYLLVPELADISLNERCKRVNGLYAKDKSVYLVSIHSNAGGGTGFEGYTTKGQTASDGICSEFLKDIHSGFPKVKIRVDRTDNDDDKEVDYQILKYTSCPATLLELLFMDNIEDYNLLLDDKFRDKISITLAKTIQRLYLL
jgi:N-acetylmuramoyl-L-alanine amidase